MKINKLIRIVLIFKKLLSIIFLIKNKVFVLKFYCLAVNVLI